MFTEDTVLVLGSGASMPYGFPSGRELVLKIIDGIRGDTNKGDLFPLIVPFPHLKHKNEWNDLMRRLNFSDCSSVDAFLEKKENQHLVDFGKQAIAVALLNNENEHTFFSEYGARTRDWYSQLFSLLNEGVTYKKISQNKLSIITFNYDRSLEYYLAKALSNLYHKDIEDAQEKLNSIPLIHVHGKLGRLPWEKIPVQSEQVDTTQSVTFGARLIWKQRQAILIAANSIKIVNEAVDDTPEFIRSRMLLQNAKKIFFLGFGFHPTNLRRLKVESLESPIVKCTTLGLSADRHKFLDEFKTRKGNAIFCSKVGVGYTVRHNKKISEFIQNVGLY